MTAIMNRSPHRKQMFFLPFHILVLVKIVCFLLSFLSNGTVNDLHPHLSMPTLINCPAKRISISTSIFNVMGLTNIYTFIRI